MFNTFQGLTVQCARCHDHKFDPIPQDDYYRLQAVFAGVGRGDVAFDPDPAAAKKRKELQATLAALEKNDPAVHREARCARVREGGRGVGGATPAPAIAWDVPESRRVESRDGAKLTKQTGRLDSLRGHAAGEGHVHARRRA